MLEDTDLLAGTPSMARAMAPGIFAAFGGLIRGGQDRKNLEADHVVVEGMLERGLVNFRYRGIAMEFESFAEAQNEEIKRLVENAVSAAMKADSVVDWSMVDLTHFSPEFRRRWIMEASNVSDETLQDLWARLLAGELEYPGSVSNDTMSIARDLNKQRAEEFQLFCSSALCYADGSPMLVVGCGSPGSNSLQPFGLSYEVLMRLAHHRLIVNDMNSYIDLSVSSNQLTIVRQQESTWLMNRNGGSEQFRIKGILLTSAGKELFAVVEKIPVPAYTAAMLKSLEKDGYTLNLIANET